MKRRDIAQRAANLVARYEQDSKIRCFDDGGGSSRFLDGIAALLGFSIHEDPTLEDGILAEINRSLGRISVRPGLDAATRGFSVAHEIGHADCHMDLILVDTPETINEESGMSMPDGGVFRGYDQASRQELEANMYAAELLAPSSVIRGLISADTEWSVEQLATHFGVSRSTMVSQLSATYLPGIWGPELPQQSKPVGLDAMQQMAVDAPTPTLVLAGPGAGKTRILVERFVALVNAGVPPSCILALTFSNKAAGEMVERIASSLPSGSQGLAVSTFHSFGLELLKLFGQHLGLPTHPKLLPPAELYAFLRDHLDSLPMGRFEDIRRPTRNLRLLISAVSRAKDELVGPTEYRRLATAWRDRLALDPTADDSAKRKAADAIDAAEFFEAYENLLAEHGVADFGDLIRFSVALLETPGVGDEIRARFGQLLVDETQDINFATSQLLKLLDGGRGIIWAVGDPRQSIYRFRGASSVNLLQFQESFPNTTVVELKKNYRSTPALVEFSQGFQIPKRAAGDDLPVASLCSSRDTDERVGCVVLCEAPDEHSELAWIASYLADQRAKKIALESHAILCRTRAQAQKVADALAEQKIPSSWAGSLDRRDAFKEAMVGLLMASDDAMALTRAWRGSESDLRALMSGRRALQTRSLSRLLYEASDAKIEGLSPRGVAEATELKKLVGTLRSFDTAGQVVERFIFELSSWSRELIENAPTGGQSARATLGELLGLAKAFSGSNPGPAGSAKSFVRFLRTAQEAGELKETARGTQSGVVNLMTMHASKGLEWPCVILPYIAKKKMPSTQGRPEVIPIPQGLIHGEDSQDELIEKACLFYVAITRAQDTLVLTYSLHYGKPNKNGNLNAGLSDYVPPALAAVKFSSSIARISASVTPEAAPLTPVGLDFDFEGPIPYAALKAYDRCPKQFEFQQILGLYDPEKGYLDFRSSVHETLAWVQEQKVGGVAVSDDAALAKHDELWRARQPSEHWYEDRYRAAAHKLILAAAADSRDGHDLEPRQVFTTRLGSSQIAIPVDIIEKSAVGRILKRVNHGPPAKSHLDDKEMALLAHVSNQINGGAGPLPQLRYPLVDQDVEAQLTAKKIGTRLADIEETAKSILSGPYLPKPDYMNCRGCFAALICPANPEDDEES